MRWCGYLSGAVQSGQRAALEVLADVSPAVLSQKELQEVSADFTRASSDLSRVWDRNRGSSSSSRLLLGLTLVAITVGGAMFFFKAGLGENWLRRVLGVTAR